MNELKHAIAQNSGARKISVIAMMFALLSLIVAVLAYQGNRDTGENNLKNKDNYLAGIVRSGTLRVGYGVFPPYTMVDLNEKNENLRVKGFSVDIVNEIARRHSPPLRVEWHRLNWDTLKADMLSGKFDFIADPVYQTITRALDFRVVVPYSYFGIAVAVVRKDDERFEKFEDLDRGDITIALAEGWTSSEYARTNLTKPKFKSVPVTGDAFNQLDEVILGRADVALNDVPTVIQYVRAHSDKVKALWIDNPPSMVPGGFMVKKDQQELAQFLDAAIRIIVADGTLFAIDKKWKSYGYLPNYSTVPGSGLQ